MGDVVDLGGAGEADVAVDVDTDASEIESALENVADMVCASWEVFGSDTQHSVVTEVDGRFVRLTVAVELV